MNKYTMYACEFCGKEFSSASECEQHEESHDHDYSFDADTVIIQRLREMKVDAMTIASVTQSWVCLSQPFRALLKLPPIGLKI